MSMLDDKNKHAFLNLILKKKENWDRENLNHVFKPSFRFIYGIEGETADLEIRNKSEISAF
jgi:hypothetical protein